ncbi:MAG TPA: YCF48-related protein [Ignavibacteria bacterium]|nr:YCF48-related protein [Ignavibacteria bacterium]
MKKYILFILFLFISSVSFSQFDWKWLHPRPQGNALKYVKVFSAADWLAVGDGGTFMKTASGGANWYITHDVTGYKPYGPVYTNDAFFFNMTTGIVCGPGGMIRRTSNGGLSFDSVPSGTVSGLNSMHFINDLTGFIAGDSGIVLKTTNSGVNWNIISTGSSQRISGIFVIDNRIYCTTTSGSILLFSYDGGNEWRSAAVSSGSYSLENPVFRDTLNGLLSGSSYVFSTTNGGINWTQLPIVTTNRKIYFHDNNWYITGSSRFILRSADDRVNWDSLLIPLTTNFSSLNGPLGISGSYFLLGGDLGSLYVSKNNGNSWSQVTYKVSVSGFRNIWCDNMNGRIIASGTFSTPYLVSTNGGSIWIPSEGDNISGDIYGMKMINSTTGYSCGENGKVYITRNGGLNWNTIASLDDGNSILFSIDFAGQDTGYVSSEYGKIYKTIDAGLNWVLVLAQNPIGVYRIDAVDANNVWMAGYYGICRYTTNGGVNWISSTSNTSYDIAYIQMVDKQTGYIAGLEGTIRRTTDSGISWDTIRTPYTITYRSISFVNESTGYVVGDYGCVMRTSTGGEDWEIKHSGAEWLNTVYCKGYDSALAGGGGGTILRLYNSLTGGVTWNNHVPEKFTLEQNYPNPFNPVTAIKFGLPKTSKVTLKVYDIVGREVSVLIYENELNAGTVVYNFDAGGLASGVYFYSLIINSEVIITRKMVLIK